MPSPEIKSNVWPAFPTDLISIAITVATQARGSVLFHDWMYPGRMYFTGQTGINGRSNCAVRSSPRDCHRPSKLFGEKWKSPDIRAGMALVLAALAVPGLSTIRNVGQIDRGYERVDEKLRALGAKIERLTEK